MTVRRLPPAYHKWLGPFDSYVYGILRAVKFTAVTSRAVNLVRNNGSAPAVHAPPRFQHHFIISESGINLLEITSPLVNGQQGCFLPWLLIYAFLGRVTDPALPFIPIGSEFFTLKITVDRKGCPFASTDSVYHRPGCRCHIAAGKDSRQCRFQCNRVNLDIDAVC